VKNINKIKRLVKSDCAGYFAESNTANNYCCSMDGVCIFFREEGEQLTSCRYFEEGVLPLDMELEHEYRQEHKMDTVGRKAKPKVNCKRCNNSFEAGSNRQIYCEKCRKIVKREQARISIQNKRNKSAWC